MPPKGCKHSSSAINSQLDDDATDNPTQKPTQKILVVPSRNLPERLTCTKAQTEITASAPKCRRSGAQKEADDLAELADLEARITELRKNHQRLAEMELEEEEEQAQNLAACSEFLDPSDEEEEFFDLNDMDAEGGDESEGDEDSITIKKSEKSQKKQAKAVLCRPVKGTTRAAINEQREVLRNKIKATNVVEGKKTNKKKKANPIPTGVYGDWKQRGRNEHVTKDMGSGEEDVVSLSEDGLGGLRDEDVEAVKVEQESVRANKLVGFVASKPPVTKTPAKEPTSKAPPTSAPGRKKATKQQAAKSEPTTATVEPSSSILSIEANPTPTPSNSRMIPAFMQDDWASKALPRLYCRLFTSDKPFESFSKVDTAALIKILQEVADICWPGHSYPIKKGSGYLETAYSRCTEKRSRIGNDCYKHVSTFFLVDPRFTSGKEIVRYCDWIMTGNGPLLYGEPSPQNIEEGTLGWKSPKRCWLGRHVIAVLTPHVKTYIALDANGAIPIGLLALVAAGLEKSFEYFSTGESTKLNAETWFTQKNMNALVVEYMESAKTTAPTRWAQVLGACGVNSTLPAEVPEIKSHSISRRRAIAYDVSSPPPEEVKK